MMQQTSSFSAPSRESHLAEMEDWVAGRKSMFNVYASMERGHEICAVVDAQEVVKHAAAAMAYPATTYVDVVFDGPPEHEAGRFVEVENMDGASVGIGQWIDRGNGLWALRIEVAS